QHLPAFEPVEEVLQVEGVESSSPSRLEQADGQEDADGANAQAAGDVQLAVDLFGDGRFAVADPQVPAGVFGVVVQAPDPEWLAVPEEQPSLGADYARHDGSWRGLGPQGTGGQAGGDQESDDRVPHLATSVERMACGRNVGAGRRLVNPTVADNDRRSWDFLGASPTVPLCHVCAPGAIEGQKLVLLPG